MQPSSDPDTSQIRAELQLAMDACNQQVLGNPYAVKFAFIAFLAGGHLLIEDLPGLGKTTLARTLAKVLGLNDTQTSVLALVFKLCDDRDLELVDFADLRAVLQYLTGAGAAELKSYGGMSKQSVGVLLRKMVELEGQGGQVFFGEPEMEITDLIRTETEKVSRIVKDANIKFE